MIKKKLFLVPLMLLAVVGSLHAASVPVTWAVDDANWIEGYQYASANENVLSWWSKTDKNKMNKSSLTYSSTEFDPMGKIVTLGALNFDYNKSCGGTAFVATLILNGLDNTIVIPFEIRGGAFTAEVPSDQEYIFSVSGHDFKLSDLELTGSGARYNLTGTVSSVPIPATAWLLGSGLLGLLGFRRRQTV